MIPWSIIIPIPFNHYSIRRQIGYEEVFNPLGPSKMAIIQLLEGKYWVHICLEDVVASGQFFEQIVAGSNAKIQ